MKNIDFEDRRIGIKKHCASFCNKIDKSKFSNSVKKQHYKNAYRQRDERLLETSQLERVADSRL